MRFGARSKSEPQINKQPAVLLRLTRGSTKKKLLVNGRACRRRIIREPYNMTPHTRSFRPGSSSCRVYGSSRRACFSWRCLMAIFSGLGGRKSDKKRRHSRAHVQRLSALVGPRVPLVVFTTRCVRRRDTLSHVLG